jgi:excisionase family DNA binding protein
MAEQLLTADQVAALLGVTRDWVYAESRAGRIPHVRLGRYYRYRQESIERWMHEIEADTFGLTANGRRTTAGASSPRRGGGDGRR